MSTRAVVVHHIPGRVRVKIPEKRHDTGFFSTVKALLPVIEGVEEVETNPLTASVLIKFTGNLLDLFQKIREQIPDIDIQSSAQASSRPVATNMKLPVVNLVSGRNLNYMFMLGTLLAAAGLVQTARGKILIPAVGFFGYAADAFWRSGRMRK
jgi:hypothetical protein